MLVIRRAVLVDAEAIHRVHMASIRGQPRSHYSATQIEAWCGGRSPERYAGSIQGKVVMVAETDGKVLGFGQLDPATAMIEAVYVSPESARRGVGTELLAALEVHAANLGIGLLSVDSSLNAVTFYESAGYTATRHTVHDVSPGVSIPCVAMQKALCNAPDNNH
jgi:putative acetyltransferase